MPGHLPAPDHGLMDSASARYTIRINGHLDATVLSEGPELVPRRHGAHTVSRKATGEHAQDELRGAAELLTEITRARPCTIRRVPDHLRMP